MPAVPPPRRHGQPFDHEERRLNGRHVAGCLTARPAARGPRCGWKPIVGSPCQVASPRVASLRASGFIRGTLHQYNALARTRKLLIAAAMVTTVVAMRLRRRGARVYLGRRHAFSSGLRASEMRRCSAPATRKAADRTATSGCSSARRGASFSVGRPTTAATHASRQSGAAPRRRVSAGRPGPLECRFRACQAKEPSKSSRSRVDRAARRLHGPSAPSGFRRRGLLPVTASGGKSAQAHGGAALPSSSHS